VFGKALHTRIHFLISTLIACLLPFKTPVPLFIALLFLNWLLEGDYKAKFSGKHTWVLFSILIGFYLLHVVGLLWTSNYPAGRFDLEVKLSFFVFPILYFTRPLDGYKTGRVFLAFLLGCSFSAVILILRSTYLTIKTGDPYWYFYERFSRFMHPGYYSMYLNLAFIYLLVLFSGKTPIPPRFKRLLMWLFPLILLSILLLSSKLGLITTVLSIVSWMGWRIVQSKRYGLGALSILGFAAVLSLLIYCSPYAKARLVNAFSALKSENTDKKSTESTAVRMLIWKSAREVIQEHPLFGTGTGDSKDALLEKYKADGLTGAYQENLNAHNGYLQVTISLGITGLLVLLLMLLLPFLKALQERKIVLAFFILLLSLNFLTESMFETQAGVMFFAFFQSLLLFSTGTGLQLSEGENA
jgi:O-antigen ligase